MPRSLLIADDSVTIRRVVELAFSDTDVRVDSAGSGAEAIEKIAALKPDLVLADVVMPEPSGYDVCRAVKTSGRPVPVLLLAGTFEPFDPERARGCGADGHLVKPFDSRTLVAQVMRLLEALPAQARPTILPPPVEPPVPIGVPPAPDEDMDAVFEDLAGLPLAALADGPGGTDDAEAAETAPSVPAPAEPVSLPVATPARAALDDDEIDAIARRVVARLSDDVVREIAWDVVPDLAEAIIRERIRRLERDDEDR